MKEERVRQLQLPMELPPIEQKAPRNVLLRRRTILYAQPNTATLPHGL